MHVQTEHARGQNVFSNIRKLFCHKSWKCMLRDYNCL
jgi:hypothetical protein